MAFRKDFPESLRVASIFSFKAVYNNTIEEFKETKQFDFNFISLLAELLHFKIESIIPSDNHYGRPEADDNWTGIIGLVQKEEADIGLRELFITYERSHVVDFSYPYLYGHLTFITDKPEHSANTYAAFYPFSFSVWVAVFASLIIVLLASYICTRRKRSFQYLLLVIWGTLLEQSIKIKCSLRRFKFLFSLWILSAIFITNAYKAVVLSFLTFPDLTGIRDTAQLSKASESDLFKCSTYEGSANYAILQSSKDESYRKIAKCMDRTNMYASKASIFLQSTSYKKAFVCIKEHISHLHRWYFISDDYFDTPMVAIAVRKSFCCKDKLNEVILRIYQTGIFDKFLREQQFFRSLYFNDSKIEESNHDRKITLKDVSAVFLLLGFGYVLSTIALVLEIIFYRKYSIST